MDLPKCWSCLVTSIQILGDVAIHGCASHLKKWRTSHMCIVCTDNVYNRLFLRDWIVGTATDCSICFFNHTSSGMHIQVPKVLILRLLQKETHSNHSGAHLSSRDQRPHRMENQLDNGNGPLHHYIARELDGQGGNSVSSDCYHDKARQWYGRRARQYTGLITQEVSSSSTFIYVHYLSIRFTLCTHSNIIIWYDMCTLPQNVGIYTCACPVVNTWLDICMWITMCDHTMLCRLTLLWL